MTLVYVTREETRPLITWSIPQRSNCRKWKWRPDEGKVLEKTVSIVISISRDNNVRYVCDTKKSIFSFFYTRRYTRYSFSSRQAKLLSYSEVCVCVLRSLVLHKGRALNYIHPHFVTFNTVNKLKYCINPADR